MSQMSEMFLHPQDVCSQGSTFSKKDNSSVSLTPEESVKEQLETSNNSLFGSEDMEQAFREYYSQFSPERLYQSFEEEVNKIKNSQELAKTKQNTCSVNAADNGFSDTFDSGKGQSDNSLINSEDIEKSFQGFLPLSPENVQIIFEKEVNPTKKLKIKNNKQDKWIKNQKTTRKPLQEQNLQVESNDNDLALEKQRNRAKITEIPENISAENELKKSEEVNELQNKRKRKTPRKIQTNENLSEQDNNLYTNFTETVNGSAGVLKSFNTPKFTNNSLFAFENEENDLLDSDEFPKTIELSATGCLNLNERPTASPMPKGLPQEGALAWLHNKRNVGLWACCDRCKKWRYLKDTTDPLDLPDKWYCYMNPDPTRNECSQPEEKIPRAQQRELIRNKYHAGSIVFAKFKGLPWWPAMVQDNPEYLTYFILKGSSIVPKYYHVIFFCCDVQATGWIHVSKLKCFRRFYKDKKVNQLKPKERWYELQINNAKMEALKALKLTTIERLFKYTI